MAAFTLAINSFFKEKRGRAIGAGMSITGLGAICMPLIMSALMSAYGWRYAVLILGAICLHSLVAAFLLRPAKWYLKDPPTTEEMEPLNKDGHIELIDGSSSSASKQNGKRHQHDLIENWFLMSHYFYNSSNFELDPRLRLVAVINLEYKFKTELRLLKAD